MSRKLSGGEKLEELKKLGIDAYRHPYPGKHHIGLYKEHDKGEENKADFADVCIAGRIMSVRDMGKANFAVIQDAVGKIQIYIKQDDICPAMIKPCSSLFGKKLLDIGDIVGIKGYVHHQNRWNFHPRKRIYPAHKIAQAIARGKGKKDGEAFWWSDRSGIPLPPALCRPDRKSRCKGKHL